MDSKDRLTAKYREREAKKRLLARFRSEEPQWHLDETALFHGDAEAVFASVKTAAFPLDKEAGGDFGNDAPVPFPKNDPGGATGKKRNIPKDHPFDPKSLKPLAKALWASSVAMGHALTAYRHLSRLKSATISPDGMLGGRGYVMEIPEIRQRLNEACESLSAITDTIHDEISAPHWKPRISELDENEAGDIQNYLNKSEEILENPEEEAENEADAIEKQNDLNEMDGVDDEGNLPQEEGDEDGLGQGAEGQAPPVEGEEGEEPAEGDEEEDEDGGSFQEDTEEGDEEAPPAEGEEEGEEPTEEGDEEPEEDEDGAAEDETLDEQEGDEGWEEEGDEDAEGGDLPPEGEDGESEEGDEEAEEPGDEEDADAEEGDEDAEEGDEEDEDEEEGDPDLAIDEDDLETAERAADATEDLWTKAKPSAVKPGGDSPDETQEEEPAEGEEEGEEPTEEADAAPADEEEEPPMPPNPKIKKKKKKKPGKPPMASELPTGGSNAGADLADKPQGPNQGMAGKQARVANSSIPVQTLPGPRVQHLDREDGPPENGPDVLDDWGTPSERDYLYPTPWENDTHHGSAAMPDAGMDDTPTEAWDFGLGYGAKGQGAGGYANPSGEGNGKGVWGPSSGLPGSPPQSSGDTTPKIDKEQNERKSRDMLPGDTDGPPARSDYYRGDRGNLVNTQSELPGEPTPGGEAAPSLMNTDEVHEDLSTPYVRYDYTTHGYRDDPLHSWPQGHHAGMKNDG